MEKVFESYVAQKLSKVFRPEGYGVSTQDRGYYLFDSPQKFRLRPDIVLRDGSGRTTIMDTKWKSLFDNPSKNYGISQGDMYQMYAYSKKYSNLDAEHAPDVWLLYPANEAMHDHTNIQFVSDDGVRVRLFFVDLADIDESLNALLNEVRSFSA